MDKNTSNAHLFQGLVVSLAAATMQHLGKTINPMTNKIEKNLPAAQGTIDMLDMLEAKTNGNLDEAEAKLIKSVLAELKMNYVETLNEKPAEAGEGKATEPEAQKKPEEAG
jgi:PBP1b-binding outer membrane lipoprotein LpoB